MKKSVQKTRKAKADDMREKESQLPDLRLRLQAELDKCRQIDPLFNLTAFVRTPLETQYETKAAGGRSQKRPPAATLAERQARRKEQNRIHRLNADKRLQNHQENVVKEHKYLAASIASCNSFLLANNQNSAHSVPVLLPGDDIDEKAEEEAPMDFELGPGKEPPAHIQGIIDVFIGDEDEKAADLDMFENICLLDGLLFNAPDISSC